MYTLAVSSFGSQLKILAAFVNFGKSPETYTFFTCKIGSTYRILCQEMLAYEYSKICTPGKEREHHMKYTVGLLFKPTSKDTVRTSGIEDAIESLMKGRNINYAHAAYVYPANKSVPVAK